MISLPFELFAALDIALGTAVWIAYTMWARVRELERPKPWVWRRSPGESNFDFVNGFDKPPPKPMHCVDLLLPDLDLAAEALSSYHWAPWQVETTLLLVDHHLHRVRCILHASRKEQA